MQHLNKYEPNVALEGYNNSFIKSVFLHYSKSRHNSNSQLNVIQSKKKFHTFPFTDQNNYIIRGILNKLKDDTIFTFKKLNSLRAVFSQVKDPPLGKNCDLVYNIPCDGCSKQYVGETLQYLQKSINRHEYDQNKQNGETALAVHSKATGHKFEFDNTKILLSESNTRKRKIREVIEIIKNNTINFETDSARIGSIYAPVICDR